MTRHWVFLGIIALGIGALGGLSLSAQDRAPQPKPPAAKGSDSPPPDPGTADISFTSTVTARELRFHDKPRTDVQFSGQPKRHTGSATVRHNLPPRVEPKVTYRGISIQLTISSVFDEEDVERILSKALAPAPAKPQAARPGTGKKPASSRRLSSPPAGPGTVGPPAGPDATPPRDNGPRPRGGLFHRKGRP